MVLKRESINVRLRKLNEVLEKLRVKEAIWVRCET